MSTKKLNMHNAIYHANVMTD